MFLLLSILSSTVINLVFRYFPKYQVDNQQAIAVNYFTCVITGLIASGLSPQVALTYYETSWGLYTIILGLFFVSVFYGMAVTAQKLGISVSVIAAKMGVIFPLIYAFFFLNEEVRPLLVIGIILSILSVFFVSKKDKIKTVVHSKTLLVLLPILVLVGSGIIDTSLKIIEQQLSGVSAAAPTIMIFGAAAIFGTIVAIYRFTTGKTSFAKQNIIGGIALGIPNYFSIYFLIKSLQSNVFTTSQVYPINNIGVVVLSTVLSVIIFKEHLNKRNIAGIVMAIIAIILISLP